MPAVNFLVKEFRSRYYQMENIVLGQLLEVFEENQINRETVINDPLFEEFYFENSRDLVLATILVAETQPLTYNIVARFDRETMNYCANLRKETDE